MIPCHAYKNQNNYSILKEMYQIKNLHRKILQSSSNHNFKIKLAKNIEKLIMVNSLKHEIHFSMISPQGKRPRIS